MEKIDISTQEKRDEVYSIFNRFKTKQEIHKYFNITDNTKGCEYIKEIASKIGFDLNIYKERKKKYCLFCGKRLNPGQKKFCSCSCSAKYFNKGKKLNEETKKKISDSLKKTYKEKRGELASETKFCCVCGAPLPRGRNKYCSFDCQKTTYKRKKSEEIQCQYCGKKFLGRSDRKYCSTECANKHEEEKKIQYWKEGIWIINPNFKMPKSIKSYLLEKAEYKCEECGFSGNNKKTGKTILQIHHKDGNCSNNKEENLQVLCPNCHAMTENYMALNKGKSARKKRYKK